MGHVNSYEPGDDSWPKFQPSEQDALDTCVSGLESFVWGFLTPPGASESNEGHPEFKHWETFILRVFSDYYMVIYSVNLWRQ